MCIPIVLLITGKCDFRPGATKLTKTHVETWQFDGHIQIQMQLTNTFLIVWWLCTNTNMNTIDKYSPDSLVDMYTLGLGDERAEMRVIQGILDRVNSLPPHHCISIFSFLYFVIFIFSFPYFHNFSILCFVFLLFCIFTFFYFCFLTRRVNSQRCHHLHIGLPDTAGWIAASRGESIQCPAEIPFHEFHMSVVSRHTKTI